MQELIAPAAAFFGVVLTAGFGLYWNFRSAKAARKQPFLLRQLDLCHDASLTAARLATLQDRAAWNEARQRFWELYFGPLSIVEDAHVKAAMETFGAELEGLGDAPVLPAGSLQDPSYQLARKIRVLILRSWSIQSLAEVLRDEPPP
jgi:hypothetical protein